MKRSLPPTHNGPARRNHFAPGRRSLLYFILALVAACSFLAFLGIVTPAAVSAQGGELQNQPRRGLIYTGLRRSERPGCRPGFEFRTPNTRRPFCTHGPDPAPLGTNVKESAAPLAENGQAGLVACDADGESENRVEVIYARASDKPDRFATYAASIQQWAADVDRMVSISALQTGSDRHVRYVHDSACQILVSNVVLPPQGDDSIGSTITALENLGYNRSDRKYLVYMDATVYCGIATTAMDDSLWATNLHNLGRYYARVDAGCWGSAAAAHELMHTLGGVQPTAPHSTPRWHCSDESDRMCYADGSGIPMQYFCDSANESYFDCNHDDYFSTNPPPNSYLATHWNSANNIFLSGAVPLRGKMRVDSFEMGTVNKKGIFTPDDSFKRGKMVQLRGVTRDQDNTALESVRTILRVTRPNSSVQCELTLESDSAGNFTAECEIPRNAPLGQWVVQVALLSKPEYVFDQAAITSYSFAVTAK